MTERDTLISQYIDDELTLDEKIDFVCEIGSDGEFLTETVSMLETERMMPAAEVPPLPEISVNKRIGVGTYAAFTALAASLVLMVKVFMFASVPVPAETAYRFVIYQPEAKQVALAGSFSGWQPMEMHKAGRGYWQVMIPLKKGEYSYSYIVNGDKQLPDPTVQAKQSDGFGGENSIINIGEKI